MYLLDTVVLSELRKRERDAGIVNWPRGKDADALFLSAITMGEVERGVAGQRVRNPVLAEALGAWLDHTIVTYRDRILPVDTPVGTAVLADRSRQRRSVDRGDRVGARAECRHPQCPTFRSHRRCR